MCVCGLYVDFVMQRIAHSFIKKMVALLGKYFLNRIKFYGYYHFSKLESSRLDVYVHVCSDLYSFRVLNMCPFINFYTPPFSVMNYANACVYLIGYIPPHKWFYCARIVYPWTILWINKYKQNV